MSSGEARPSASDAAALVRAERRRAAACAAPAPAPAPPKHEAVQEAAGWVGAEAGDVDESELERRQRAIGARLVARQRQLEKDGAELERVRVDLAALEAPLKAEIMSLRTALEETNRREKALVDEVNRLRDALHGKEQALVLVRAEKQQHADGLIGVMADYEKRKTDALNGIARLVGEEPLEAGAASPAVRKAPNFAGF
jgi:chromosome segregation ATPase